MAQFQKLITLRNKYPSTTSAAHAMALIATDLENNYVVPAWTDFHGESLAPLAFEESLDETITWAIRESRVSEPSEVLAFLKVFLTEFFEACPNWSCAHARIENRLNEKVNAGCLALREGQRALSVRA